MVLRANTWKSVYMLADTHTFPVIALALVGNFFQIASRDIKNAIHNFNLTGEVEKKASFIATFLLSCQLICIYNWLRVA